jgi:hypothetical protein
MVVPALRFALALFMSLLFILRFRIQPKSESLDFDPLKIWIYSFKLAINHVLMGYKSIPGLINAPDKCFL